MQTTSTTTTTTTSSSSFEKIVAESVKATIGNRESTMNSSASSSIGAFLLRLAKNYLPNEERDSIFKNATEERRKEIINKVIEDHIESFYHFVLENKAKLKITEEKVEKIKSYLRAKFDDPITELDMATTFTEEGVEKQTAFPLKEVFALVCAATLDNEAYKDKKSEDNKIPRVETLVNALINLINENRCRQGIRNDLVGTLNYVYPGAHFIENIDAFLYELVINIITRKLAEQPQTGQFQIIKEWITNGGEHLDNFLNGIKNALRSEIEDEFKRQGINPQSKDISEKIENSLNNLNCLNPLLDIKNARVFSNVLMFIANYKKNHEELPLPLPLKNAEDVLNTSNLTLDTMPQSILDLAAVIDAYTFYREKRWLLWGDETIIAAGKNLNQLCESYFTEPANEKLIEINSIHEELKKYLKDINGEKTSSFIENFFPMYLINNPQQKTEMYMLLLKQMEAVKIPDYFIEKIQQQLQLRATNREEVEIESYLISRILLHAVLVSPAYWTEGFYNLLSIIVNFINNGLNLEEGNPNRTALTNSLKNFLPEISGFLMPLYVRMHPNVTGNNEFLPNVEMPILANLEGLHEDILGAYKNKVYSLQKMRQFDEEVFVKMGYTYLLFIKLDFLNIPFPTFVLFLPAERSRQFLSFFGKERMEIMIKNGEISFFNIFHVVNENSKMWFLTEFLDADFVRKKIEENDNILTKCLSSMPENVRIEFLKFLGVDLVYKEIKKNNILVCCLSLLPAKEDLIVDFLKFLGPVFVREEIKKNNILESCLSRIPKNARMEFFEFFLGPVFVRKEIGENDELLSTCLSYIPNAVKVKFLIFLKNADFVRRKIEKDDLFLIKCLSITSKEELIEFLNFLGTGFICKEIKGNDELFNYLSRMPANTRVEFLKLLGIEFVNKAVKEYDAFVDVLSYIPKEDKNKFLDFLASKSPDDGDLKKTTGSCLTTCQSCMFKPVEQTPIKITEEDQTQKNRGIPANNSYV